MRAPSALMLAVLTAGSACMAGVTPAAAEPAPVSSAAAVEDELLGKLTAIPGLTVVSQTRSIGYRFFVLRLTQPVDHRDPGRGTYQQRLTLLHRSADAPTVLSTGGYSLPITPRPSQTEPTRLLDANQVSVEHRFFRASRPDPMDWKKLDIRQEADDEHRIVEALKTIYTGKWIQTGASKGGMASVYHRRFYPDDVDGVVAYVTPNDRVNPSDRAYDDFFANVATRACRTALENVQIEALKRRKRLVPKLVRAAALDGLTFRRSLGTPDRSFELTVLDTAWVFWHYSWGTDCSEVPATTASDDEIYDWIDDLADFSFHTDQGIARYIPYYYQAASQLGWPELKFAHLRHLTRYPKLYQPNSVLPPELRPKHDPKPMLDVDRWVRKESSRMMFIYGENDPWSAERFTPSQNDSHLYVAPRIGHSANISWLSPADRAAAIATLERWAGLSDGVTVNSPTPPPLPADDMLPTRGKR
ncbi:S28 family serine protease [Streptosporangium sp. NPDC049644]|uniref:S28 family serine protease n=1 Tax=Streptosporangium sp. NPDC049644 TaxID=3155507 RepID=UPI003432C5D5